MFVVQNMKQFKSNTEVRTNNTRHSTDLHLPFSRLPSYQRRTFYVGIRIFNSLHFEIKTLTYSFKQFDRALKIFIFIHSIHCRNILTYVIISNYYVVLVLPRMDLQKA